MNKTIIICVIILLLGLTESKKSLKDLINKGISQKRNVEVEKEIFKKISEAFGVKKSNINNIAEIAKKIAEAFGKKKTNQENMGIKTAVDNICKKIAEIAKKVKEEAEKNKEGKTLNIISTISETYKKIVEEFKAQKEQNDKKTIESLVKQIATVIYKNTELFKNKENIINAIAEVHKKFINSFDKKKIFDAISKTNKKH